jgi:SAM-dependent methyltransferase
MLSATTGLSDPVGLDVLDLGCGFGGIAAWFAAAGARVTAVDVNRATIQVARAVAREHGLPVSFLEGPMEGLDLPAGSQDLVVLNNSLCYVKDPAARAGVLRRVHDLLTAGGRLYSRNPNRWHPVDQFTGIPLLALLGPSAASTAASRLGRRRPDVRTTSPRAARLELRAAGFAYVVRARDPAARWPAGLADLAPHHDFCARRNYDRRGQGS